MQTLYTHTHTHTHKHWVAEKLMNTKEWWEVYCFVVSRRKNKLSRDLIVLWLNVDINIGSVALRFPPPVSTTACCGETFTFTLMENILVEYTFVECLFGRKTSRRRRWFGTRASRCENYFEIVGFEVFKQWSNVTSYSWWRGTNGFGGPAASIFEGRTGLIMRTFDIVIEWRPWGE